MSRGRIAIDVDVEKNQSIREIAHEALDRLMDEVDGQEGYFGVLGIDVSFQNGYFRSVEEKRSRTHK